MVARPLRHIVALGGGGFLVEPRWSELDGYILDLVPRARPRVCFVPTASGDADVSIGKFRRAFGRRAEATHLALFKRTVTDLRRFVLDQDVVYVGGGNTANALAIWRLHGLDRILREAWRAGVVLCGVCAGALCWFEGGVTDSFDPRLGPLDDGLRFLTGSFCPYYDGEVRRRPTYRRLIRAGRLAAGWAVDVGAALHFVGMRLAAAVTNRGSAAAYRLERAGRSVVETKLAMTRIR